jgi:hypothetical protein
MTFIKGDVTLNLVDYDRPRLTMMALDDHGLLYFIMFNFARLSLIVVENDGHFLPWPTFFNGYVYSDIPHWVC